MAQKIIGIKLEVDAEQGKKIGLVFQQAEKSADGLAAKTKNLQAIEQERIAIINKQNDAYINLNKIISKVNQAYENNSKGANLGYGNATRALEGYQRIIERTTAALDELKRKQTSLALQNNFGLKEQGQSTPAKAPAVNYSYATGAYKDKEAEYRAYMLSMEEMAHAENEKYKKGLETKKFADQAYINSAKVMYAQMFDEIAAKEAEASRRAKPVDARTVNAITQNPYASYNTATGAKSFKPVDTFDPQAEAAKVRAAVEYENTLRDAGRNKQLVAQAKHAADSLAIEQKLAKDIELVRQRVSGGFISKGQGFEEQRKAVDEYGRALKALPSLNPHIAEHKNLFIHIGEIIGAYRVLNFTLNSVINAVKAIPKIGIELESTVASLTATMGAMETGGSSAGMIAAMRALNEEAKRTGINIATLRENFRGFQASTSLAGESLDSTWNIFTKLNTTITGLHLNADKAKGIFNALAQIFNKNKVQSEELVKQLGNLLPGAFASFAKANQGTFKTTQDLIEQMRKGQVFAHQTVENFANFLAERFGPAFALAERGINANLGRMETSFTKLGEAIYGTTSGPILAFVKGITSINEGLIEAIEGTTTFGKSLQTAFSIAGTAALSATAGYLVIVVSRMERLISLAKGVGAVASSILGVSTATGVLSGAVSRAGAGIAAAFGGPQVVAIAAVTAGITALLSAIGMLNEKTNEAKQGLKEFLADIDKKIEASKPKPISIQIDEDAAVKTAAKALKAQEEVVKKYKQLQTEGVKATTVEGRWEKVEVQLKKEEANLAKIVQAYKNAREVAEASIKVNIDNGEALDKLEAIRRKAELTYLEASGQKEKAAALRFDITNSDELSSLENAVEKAKDSIESWNKTVENAKKFGDSSIVSDEERERIDKAKAGLEAYRANIEAIDRLKAAREATVGNAKDKEDTSLDNELKKAERLRIAQEDQAAKLLELKRKDIQNAAKANQEEFSQRLDSVKFMYDSEYIAFSDYVAKKSKIEEEAKLASIKAISDEMLVIQEKIDLYKQVPAEVEEAQKILNELSSTTSSPDIDISLTAESYERLQKLVEEYNNSLGGTNSRLDEIKRSEQELVELRRQQSTVSNNAANIARQNAQDTVKYYAELEKSIININQSYYDQLGVLNKIAITESVNAKYAAELKRLSEVPKDSTSYDAAQTAIARINTQKEIEINDKVLEGQRKQEDNIKRITNAYREMGFTASDALNLQLKGFGELITAFDAYGQRQQNYAAQQQDLIRQQEDIAVRINAIGSRSKDGKLSDSQVAEINELDKQYKDSYKARQKLQEQETLAKIGDVRKIAGVTKGFFAENTKARQTLHNVEMTLGAVETATKLASLAIDGAKAILTQGQGDPYTAFARIAAMTALVAAVIAGVGGAMTKTGTSSSSMPVSDAKGTTFGAPDQDATDLVDTLAFLSDINYKSYRELRKLNENFSGISDDIYRLTLLQASGKALLPVRPTLEGTFPGTNILNTLKSPDPFQNIIQKNSANKMNKDLITGVLMRALMGTTTIKVIDEGIITARTTIASLLRGEQVLVQQYATIEATKKSLFGKSTEIFDSLSKASNGASTIVTSLYTNIAKSVINLARNVSEVELNKAFNYVIPELKVSLQGKNTAEIQKTLQGVISKQLNLMSLKVFSVFKDLRQLKEGMFSTVSRIFAEREIVEASFKDIGVTSLPTANVEAIKFSDAMIQLSSTTGTAVEKIKAFQQAESDFYKNFVSKNQQNLDVVTNVAEGLFSVFEKGLSTGQGTLGRAIAEQEARLASLSAALERTKITDSGSPEVIDAEVSRINAEQAKLDALKAQTPKSLRDYFQEAFASTGNFGDALILVKRQLDLATDSGKETYSLINDLNDITAKYNDLTKELYDSIDKQVATLRDSIDLRTQDQLLEALRASRDINEQKELATKIQKLMLDKHNAEINSIKTITSAYKALGDLVKNMLLGDLSTLGPKAKLDEARSQYESTLATAQGSDKVAAAEAAQKLGSIAQAYLQQAKTYYSSTTAYASIFASVTATLKALADSVPDTTTETTVTQAVIDSTNATLAALDTLRKAVTEALSETLKVEITNAQDSVEQDTPKGVGTLEALFNKLATADKGEKALINRQIAAYNAGYKKSGTTGAELALAAEQERQVAKATLKGKEGEYNLAKKNKDKTLMATLALDIAEAKAIIAAKTAVLRTVGFKASGGDAFGPTIVGERGMEFINLPRGSSVSSNAQTNSIIAMANKQVIAELQGMNKELRSLNDRMGDIERKSRLSKSERTLV